MLKEVLIIKGAFSDGEVLSKKINYGPERFYMSVVCYSDSTYSTPILPTSGEVVVNASESGESWGEVGVIDLTVAEYDRLTALGGLCQFKAAGSSVVGATHFKVRVFGYE